MPHFVVDKVQNALNDHSKSLRGSHVHVSGVAYKKNIDDVRESPALDIIHLLTQRGARLTFSDPYVPSIRVEHGEAMLAVDLMTSAAQADCVVIVTDHSGLPYAELVEKSKLVVDTRNALKGIASDKIVRL